MSPQEGVGRLAEGFCYLKEKPRLFKSSETEDKRIPVFPQMQNLR